MSNRSIIYLVIRVMVPIVPRHAREVLSPVYYRPCRAPRQMLITFEGSTYATLAAAVYTSTSNSSTLTPLTSSSGLFTGSGQTVGINGQLATAEWYELYFTRTLTDAVQLGATLTSSAVVTFVNSIGRYPPCLCNLVTL